MNAIDVIVNKDTDCGTQETRIAELEHRISSIEYDLAQVLAVNHALLNELQQLQDKEGEDVGAAMAKARSLQRHRAICDFTELSKEYVTDDGNELCSKIKTAIEGNYSLRQSVSNVKPSATTEQRFERFEEMMINRNNQPIEIIAVVRAFGMGLVDARNGKDRTKQAAYRFCKLLTNFPDKYTVKKSHGVNYAALHKDYYNHLVIQNRADEGVLWDK